MQQLEQLKAFAGFIDFLENPEKYKKLLVEAKVVVEEAYKAALTKINERMVGKVYIVQDQLTIVDFMFAELIMNS